MRTIAALILLFALASCGEDVTTPRATGSVVVYIYWNGQGLEGKQVDIVETGETLMTDARGLARFDLAPGHYTVRAYDINQGGPCCGYVDRPVLAKSGETTRIEIFDCRECEAPGRIPGT